jgi:hypothetical protein
MRHPSSLEGGANVILLFEGADQIPMMILDQSEDGALVEMLVTGGVGGAGILEAFSGVSGFNDVGRIGGIDSWFRGEHVRRLVDARAFALQTVRAANPLEVDDFLAGRKIFAPR